jgi:hypothetical protein
VVAQHQHPGIEGAGHDGRQQSRSRNQIEPEGATGPDGRGSRRYALPADDVDAVVLHTVEQDRHVAAGPVEMRLDDLQREAGRHRGVEGIAALLEDRHAGCRRQPMRRCHDAEGAEDFRPGGEFAHDCLCKLIANFFMVVTPAKAGVQGKRRSCCPGCPPSRA